jgi:hypothetical protein
MSVHTAPIALGSLGECKAKRNEGARKENTDSKPAMLDIVWDGDKKKASYCTVTAFVPRSCLGLTPLVLVLEAERYRLCIRLMKLEGWPSLS